MAVMRIQEQNSKITALIMLIAIALIILAFVAGCKHFDVVNIPGQPAECNDFYTVMKYYAVSGKGDSAFVGTVYNECKEARGEARKIVKEKHCKDLIFGADPLDKRDYKRYSDFLECTK